MRLRQIDRLHYCGVTLQQLLELYVAVIYLQDNNKSWGDLNKLAASEKNDCERDVAGHHSRGYTQNQFPSSLTRVIPSNHRLHILPLGFKVQLGG